MSSMYLLQLSDIKYYIARFFRVRNMVDSNSPGTENLKKNSCYIYYGNIKVKLAQCYFFPRVESKIQLTLNKNTHGNKYILLHIMYIISTRLNLYKD